MQAKPNIKISTPILFFKQCKNHAAYPFRVQISIFISFQMSSDDDSTITDQSRMGSPTQSRTHSDDTMTASGKSIDTNNTIFVIPSVVSTILFFISYFRFAFVTLLVRRKQFYHWQHNRKKFCLFMG